MAIKYNLAKVYAHLENDTEKAELIIVSFVTEIPKELKQIKKYIKNKKYKKVYALANKIKPTFDLLGLNIAFEEILQIEAWTKLRGRKKDIIETYKSIRKQVKKASKEMKKDFNL